VSLKSRSISIFTWRLQDTPEPKTPFQNATLARRLRQKLCGSAGNLPLLLAAYSGRPRVPQSDREYRLVWVGSVVPSPDAHPTPHVELLVVPAEKPSLSKEMFVVTRPISDLFLMGVGQGVPETPPDELASKKGEMHPRERGRPCDAGYFPGHEWRVDVSFGVSNMCLVSVKDIPALEIGALAGKRRFVDSPLCIVADERNGRLLIFPCWELFRFYYAWSSTVARLVFQFPAWQAQTLDAELLRWFDGHCFGAGRFEEGAGLLERRYAGVLLEAIGRDASVSYALTGRSWIRAVPPFIGPARLWCVGSLAKLGGFETLFVQHVIDSRRRCDTVGGVRWRRRTAAEKRWSS
jgi:hypothetical protein